jgi:hypothetical protein
MTDGERVPPIVEHVIRALAGGAGEDRDERATTFARGLALGALVGAAIAGSTIWQRRIARRSAAHHAPASPQDETPKAP